ncbi:MAG: hypothetical protein IT449_00900 [Phycisphaerales bacterium]|nr:hypothetical protein [Phycisphaerales bacterium]
MKLVKCLDGRETNVASNTYTPAATATVRIKAAMVGVRINAAMVGVRINAATVVVRMKGSGSAYTIWVDGTQKISTTDGDLAWGTVALSGRSPKFSNVKVGYDNNSDGDIDDPCDIDTTGDLDDAGDPFGMDVNAASPRPSVKEEKAARLGYMPCHP